MSAPQTKTPAANLCWNCQAPTLGEHFCPGCGKIQPLPEDTDYFGFFALPKKLLIDSAELEKRFHQLSWKLHPDNFVRASGYERDLSLDRSSQLNDAYRTLRGPISRVEYLLRLAGTRKEGETRQQAPPELLEEVFEMNEALDELRRARQAGRPDEERAALEERLGAAQKSFEEKLSAVDAELAATFRQWDAAVDAGAGEAERKALMGRMNEILNRRSYIRNLVSNVQEDLRET
jgi:molecular chaperone HscB